MFRVAFVLTLSLVIGGCSAFGPLTMEQKDAKLGGYGTYDFRVGFHGGCQSGYRNAGNPYNPYNKDRVRYEQGGDYTKGWDEGYERCYAEYSAIVNMSR